MPLSVYTNTLEFSFSLLSPKPSLLTMLKLKFPNVYQQFVHSSALAHMWLSYLVQTEDLWL